MTVRDKHGGQAHPVKVAIIAGTMETSLHPVPPVADSAPQWNVFRLGEAESDLEIHVISPCEAQQYRALQAYPADGNYHHVVFGHAGLWCYRRLLRHILPLRLAGRRLAQLPDLMSWWYLHRARRVLDELQPDLVIINARPQYVRYLRRIVPPGRLLLFMRGEMGESRRFLHLLDGIIVNSEGMADYARRFVNGHETPIWQMPNTLGDEFVVPEAPGDRFTRPDRTVLFVGRIIPVKGVRELIAAFALVLDEIPEVRLTVCGASTNYKLDGDLTGYEAAVREQAAELSAGSARFEGYVPNTRMGKHYTQSAVAVFPSIGKESFGMVALEAMRCKTPVVASRSPGFEELIVPGETGLLVDDPTDAPALAAAMLRVLRDSDLARRMGRAGYQRSLGYTPSAAIQCLEQIVDESVVSSKPGYDDE